MEFFKTLSDADIYSDKITHIYLYKKIDNGSIDELIDNVKNACQVVKENDIIKNPKPILVHINSPGGDVYAMLRCYSIFKDCTVPIATIVDGSCASAAAIIHLLSPYRIGTEFSLFLIHEATRGMMYEKLSDVHDEIMDSYNMNEIIFKRSNITKNKLEHLMKHDLYLDYKTCLKYGFYDRIVKKQRKEKNKNIDVLKLLKDHNTNKIYISCSKTSDYFDGIKNIMVNIDEINQSRNELTPIVFKIQNNICFTSSVGTITQIMPIYNKLNIIKTCNVGIIDTIVNITDIIPILTCDKIVMTSTSAIIINIAHLWSIGGLIDDTNKNTKIILNFLKKVLKFHTKLPTKLIENIDKIRIMLKPEQCIKYEIVDEIINI